MGSTDTILEGTTQDVFGPNFGFISFSGSEEEYIKRFPIIQSNIGHSSHLGCRARSLNKSLEENHRRSITSKFGSI